MPLFGKTNEHDAHDEHEKKINKYLESMGFPGRLEQANEPGLVGVVKLTLVEHTGINITVALDRDQFVSCSAGLGGLPTANIAPLMRRLLVLNGLMGGPRFSITEGPPTQVILSEVRKPDGLDLVEFRAILDSVSAAYYQHALPIVQEFQILPLPVA